MDQYSRPNHETPISTSDHFTTMNSTRTIGTCQLVLDAIFAGPNTLLFSKNAKNSCRLVQQAPNNATILERPLSGHSEIEAKRIDCPYFGEIVS